MKLWLDDERDPKNKKIQEQFGAIGDEVWVKTASTAIARLKQGNITFISLDHDLGNYSDVGTGYDVAKWIEEQAFHGTLAPLNWNIHSQNEVGAKNMFRALINADRYWMERMKNDSV